MESYAEIVRARRIQIGLSLRKFAKLIEVSPTYHSHVESGKLPPPAPDKIVRSAEVLGFDETWLLHIAGRWPEAAAEACKSRPTYRKLVQLTFAMDEESLQELISDIEIKLCDNEE